MKKLRKDLQENQTENEHSLDISQLCDASNHETFPNHTNEIVFTHKDREHYHIQSHKAVFQSPEEEFDWAKEHFKTCTKCKVLKDLTHYRGNTAGTDAFDKFGYRLRRPECALSLIHI